MRVRRRLAPHIRIVSLAVGAGAVAFAWVATSLEPFSWPAHIAVLGSGVVAVAIGARGRPALPAPAASFVGVGGWVVLVVALAVWEVSSYLQQPREDHPTLSSIADGALDGHPVRAAAFVVWLALGVDLARR
jgi:hypothetical protein